MSSLASQIPSLKIIYSTIYSGADKENTSKFRWDCAFDKISVAWNEGKSICPFVGYMRFPVPEHQTWTNSIRLFHRQMFAIRSNTDLEKVILRIELYALKLQYAFQMEIYMFEMAVEHKT